MNQATKDFISLHIDDDVHALALKSSSNKEVDISLSIRQIEGMQTVKSKVPTFYRCDLVLYPQKLSLEQSSSEITAKYKSSLCAGEKIIDLTGGFGIDSYFLSANFDTAIYVERQKELCELAKNNFEVLGQKNIEVVNSEAEDFLKNNFYADWIYIDPARRKKSGNKAVLLSDCEPDVNNLQSILLEKAQNVMIKLSPMFDLSQLQRELKQIKTIYTVSVDNECKEIVVILERNISESPEIKAVNILKNGKIEMVTFTENEEKETISDFAKNVNKYIYEPNVAILKAGAFKIIGKQFNLHKLHINSHLYTSNELKEYFPGRKFEVIEVIPFNKENIKKIDLKKANLSVRNFPLNVNELRKKLKLSDGGDAYIFATTLINEKKVLIICSKAK